MLAFLIAAFNQLSGINALLYYSTRIFEMAGASADFARLQSVIVGATNLVFTMLAMAVIDHFGRKKLMFIGSIGYIISLSSVAWAFYTDRGGVIVLASFILFIASHAFGPVRYSRTAFVPKDRRLARLHTGLCAQGSHGHFRCWRQKREHMYSRFMQA
jgi:Na+/melibiose symporter-like transporter